MHYFVSFSYRDMFKGLCFGNKDFRLEESPNGMSHIERIEDLIKMYLGTKGKAVSEIVVVSVQRFPL